MRPFSFARFTALRGLAIPLLLLVLSPSAPVLARTFTGHTGTKVEAEVVSVSLPKSSARLRLPSGQEYDVPFANVSAADQAFLRQWKPAAAAVPTVPVPVPAVTPEALPSATPTQMGRPGSSALPVKPSTAPLGAPGETISLEFPDLPKDRSGAVAACKVRLPGNYDPAKSMPLLLWFAGGDGSNDPRGGASLVDTETFAVAAMPYPGSVGTPKNALDKGEMDVIRDYHMAMLKKLVATLGNVDPKLKFAAGFSNGAHTVGTYLAAGEKEFVEFFHGFILVEGGCRETKSKKTLRNKYAYLAWGASEGNTEAFMAMTKAAVKEARLKVTNRAMP
ncbi:MAG TPA: hypothetical protein VF585_01650, partial [Chthoniobacterales bacterium]